MSESLCSTYWVSFAITEIGFGLPLARQRYDRAADQPERRDASAVDRFEVGRKPNLDALRERIAGRIRLGLAARIDGAAQFALIAEINAVHENLRPVAAELVTRRDDAGEDRGIVEQAEPGAEAPGAKARSTFPALRISSARFSSGVPRKSSGR